VASEPDYKVAKRRKFLPQKIAQYGLQIKALQLERTQDFGS
jgi:hypothetical protein